jgi:hypothetical protein
VADLREALGGDGAVTFLVSAGLVYEVVAAACSSPQTTEINADKRADTLMKWVYLGLAQSALLIGAGAVMSKRPDAVIAGGGSAALLMYLSYVHARAAGLRSSACGTEG